MLSNVVEQRTADARSKLDVRKAGVHLRRIVLRWFGDNARDFPWRRSRNPYEIFVAEILLRQTQAERVVEPYRDLVTRFPTPESLSLADVSELREWFRPLGLITRADRLVAAAKILIEQHRGIVPNGINALRVLPGMGEYSARAVLCLAYGTPTPMIDESSGRLLRRVLGLTFRGPAYSDTSLLQIASKLLPRKSSRDFNLGLLDIAAEFCHSQKPKCRSCPLLQLCAFGNTGI
jgi:A/G-specific adenine glycosylase